MRILQALTIKTLEKYNLTELQIAAAEAKLKAVEDKTNQCIDQIGVYNDRRLKAEKDLKSSKYRGQKVKLTSFNKH